MQTISRLLICGFAVCLIAVVSQLIGARALEWRGYTLLAWAAILTLSLQWLAFIPAFIKKTEVFYDLMGSLNYLVLVWVGAWWAHRADLLNTRRSVIVIMVSLWAIRLGGYLFLRVKRRGKDARFDELKYHAPSFLMAWTLQALWVYITLIPAMVIMTRDVHVGPLHWIELLGWILWCVGWTIELVADHQKSRFQKRAETKEQWINHGLWSVVQHPNYAGEIILWLGIFTSGLPHYSAGEWWAILSPALVFCLLRYVSGIPLLQDRARARWGDDPEYRAYAESTPLLVPKFSQS